MVGAASPRAEAPSGKDGRPADVVRVTPPRPPRVRVQVPLTTELAQVAEAAIAAKNAYLVDGAGDAEVPVEYRAWLASIRPELDQRRTGLTAAALAYTSQHVVLTNASVTVEGTVATVVADVESKFGMAGIDGNTGVPPVTAGGEQLHFTFSAAHGSWVLDHVDTNDVGGLYYPADEVPTDLATAAHPPASVPVVDAESPVVADPDAATSGLPGLLDLYIPPDDDSNRKRANRNQVVAYAIAHSGVNGHPYNGSYRAFKQDCTNFVSQSMNAGGWAETQLRSYDPTKAWWYTAPDDFVTSWTAAQHFYWFVDDNGWAPKRTTLASFRPGDVMQAKMPKHDPKHITHSMVVTARDSRGNLFLTYHTGDWENTPYVDFYSRAHLGGQEPMIYGWNAG
jgi:hypothetical protein